MKTPKHTSGPWTTQKLKMNECIEVWNFEAGVRVGYLNPNKGYEANAHLIAAAPCMIEALEEYVRDLPESDKSYYGMLFKQVIKKARGGS